MTALAVLSNPASGANRRHRGRELARVRRVACRAGLIHHELDGCTELPGLIDDLAHRGVRVLAINGGDGTVVAVATALLAAPPACRPPALALLRGGTTNMIAADAGLAGGPAAALRRLADATARAAPAHAPIRRRTLHVRRAGAPDRYGFFLSTAAGPRVMDAARARLHTRGLTGPTGWTAALVWSFLRLMGGRIAADPLLHPDDCQLAVDGERAQAHRVVLLLATTLERLLLGMRPVPRGPELGVAAILWPYSGLWYRLPGLLAGRGRDGDGILRRQCARLDLHTRAGCMLDGERIDGRPDAPIQVSAGPWLDFVRA